MSIFHQFAILSSHKGYEGYEAALDGVKAINKDVDGLFLDALSASMMQTIKDKVRSLQARYARVIVFGAGASLSCGHIYSAWALPLYGGMVGAWGGQSLVLCDSIDRVSLRCLMEDGQYGVASTCYVFISRSGETLETIWQWRYVSTWLRSQGVLLSQHGMVVLGERDSALGAMALREGVDLVCFDERVSGRFSPLREVGVLIGLLAGVDMDAVCRAGQAHAQWAVWGEGQGVLRDHVLWHDAQRRQGRHISVCMGYGDRLYGLLRWYRQLWAESLGKAGQGLTPFEAMGPRDQHSQLQLWLEGEDDKTYTVIGQREQKEAAHALCALQQDCRLGTQDALLSRGRPVRVITYDTLGEDVLGALIVQCMVETYTLCRLWGINPFDQPAVADGKLRTTIRFNGRGITIEGL
ncbi:MAG: hypothetical protein GDA54_03930 [Alphaproteobacteria bacterium GM7ARS4]|nr:hypothetical protein [Alphaproteobacteria bacterium GM7ARS4]